MNEATTEEQFGKLAAEWCGQRLSLQVCQSRAGFYVGTQDAEGLPFSRESIEYWPKRGSASRQRGRAGAQPARV